MELYNGFYITVIMGMAAIVGIWAIGGSWLARVVWFLAIVWLGYLAGDKVGEFYGRGAGVFTVIVAWQLLGTAGIVIDKYIPRVWKQTAYFIRLYMFAILGSLSGQRFVALHYWNGWFVKRNKKRAVKWFLKLAKHSEVIIKGHWETAVNALQQHYDRELEVWGEAISPLLSNLALIEIQTWLGMASSLGIEDASRRLRDMTFLRLPPSGVYLGLGDSFWLDYHCFLLDIDFSLGLIDSRRNPLTLRLELPSQRTREHLEQCGFTRRLS